MKVLVACEESATVRDAFRARGFDAWSCDLEPTRGDPRWHIQGDAIAATYRGCPGTNHGSKSILHLGYVTSGQWDLLIGHPDCTYLANSGAKHLYAGMKAANGPNGDRWARMAAAAQFFMLLWNAPVPHIAIENPIMLGHAKRLFGIPDASQFIQPWQFGHGECKATGLWLRNLPLLRPTNPVEGRDQRVFRMAPGPERKRDRSKTFQGIADAFARQWGDFILEQQRQAA